MGLCERTSILRLGQGLPSRWIGRGCRLPQAKPQVQRGKQGLHSPGSVAEAVLLCFCELGHRPAPSSDQEDRVVAESAGTRFCRDDFPFAHAGCQVNRRLGAGQRHGAAKAGRPRAGVALKEAEEQNAPVGVGCVLTGDAGRVRARGASQDVHLQAAVVRHRPVARDPGKRGRLVPGVLGVVGSFLNLGKKPGVRPMRQGEDRGG